MDHRGSECRHSSFGEFVDPFEIKITIKIFRRTGITYSEDKPEVMDGTRALVDAGVYPENLWA